MLKRFPFYDEEVERFVRWCVEHARKFNDSGCGCCSRTTLLDEIGKEFPDFFDYTPAIYGKDRHSPAILKLKGD